jgi:AraC family transcriptional regulator, transcriptional activator FtrA
MLHMVRCDHGAKTVNAVARRLVLPPHRDGGQAQYVPRPVPADERGRLSRLMEFIRRHPAGAHSLTSMAEHASMTPRTLQRQFRDGTGLSPVEWLIRERVGIAKDLLETPTPAMAQVAERSGFGSEESFRRHFKRLAGVSPSDYRRRFSKPAAGG